MDSQDIKCWICGEKATTGEHRTKRTDLRAEFSEPVQAQRLYYHDNNRKNRIVQSLNSDILKFPKSLCAYCNNTRTQPHDFAWATFSDGIRHRQPRVSVGSVVRANRIFRYNTAAHMLNVHLYFVKLIGCHVVEHNIAVDLNPLSQAILNNHACANIFLKLGIPSGFAGEPWIGASNADAYQNAADGKIARISWLQIYGEFAVQLFYLALGETCDGLIGAWHPRLNTSRFLVADFQDKRD
jgi:hypothetical protein